MATVPETMVDESWNYPTSDGQPMAETDWHRNLMIDLITVLRAYYAAEANVYVTGNLILCYEPGDRRRHISPDVFVVKGVEKRDRPNYLTWEEGKNPDLVIELTSQSTREEDVEDKFQLYQDRLQVPEYFLFDPLGDYLRPRLQGYRLKDGHYVPIGLVHGRMPSDVLGLHFEVQVDNLRLYNPTTDGYLLTVEERIQEESAGRKQAENTIKQMSGMLALMETQARLLEKTQMQLNEQGRFLQEALVKVQQKDAEIEQFARELAQLRQEVDELRRSSKE
jgi:Uma2 family endonuclease